MEVTIYHNPKCSKSRQTLKLLKDRSIEPRIVEYLETPPSEKELRQILARLELEPIELARTGEQQFRQLGLDQPDTSADTIIAAMVENPVLIQRPIVVAGDKAAIGRPPESVLAIL